MCPPADPSKPTDLRSPEVALISLAGSIWLYNVFRFEKLRHVSVPEIHGKALVNDVGMMFVCCNRIARKAITPD